MEEHDISVVDRTCYNNNNLLLRLPILPPRQRQQHSTSTGTIGRGRTTSVVAVATMILLVAIQQQQQQQPSSSLTTTTTILDGYTPQYDHSPAFVQFVMGLSSVAIIQNHHHHHQYVNPYCRPSLSSFRNPFDDHPTTTSLFATMYLPDDWVDDDDHDSNDGTSQSPSLTIPSMLQSPEWVAPLARIAAEYTKRMMGQINIQQIERVSVTKVAPSHVDIEAIVCDNDACVSLSVPVPFVQPCDHVIHPHQERNVAFEDCVMRNIIELDTVELQQLHHESNQNTDHSTITSISSSASTISPMDTTNTIINDIEYPSWWIFPGQSIGYAKECTSLLRILNEAEFRNEITTLVTKELYRMLQIHPSNSNEVVEIESAIAVAVGPMGMIFRVTAWYDQQYEIVDVPVAFGPSSNQMNMNDPTSLRNAVLYCIENGN